MYLKKVPEILFLPNLDDFIDFHQIYRIWNADFFDTPHVSDHIGGRFTILPPTISTIFGPRSLPPMGGRQLPPIAIWGEGIFMFNRWGGATENLPPIMGGSNFCRWGWGGDNPAMRGRLFHVRFRWGGEKCGRGEIQKSAPPQSGGDTRNYGLCRDQSRHRA